MLEVLGAFAKQSRANLLDRRLYRSVRAAFLAQLNSLNVVEVEPEVFATAQALVARHRGIGVGALDSLHVASALWLQAMIRQTSVIVASSDHAFLALARATRLRTFDPETESFGELRARLDSSLRNERAISSVAP